MKVGDKVKERGAKLKKGDVVASDNGTVCLIAWQDTKTVRMITTQHSASMVEVERRKKGGRGVMEKVMKPAAVVEYNKFMNGVDRIDQQISYYPVVSR